LANPELGAKQVCPNCQAKFYDLGKRPAHCPKCHTEFDPDEALRSRRVRGRPAAPEHEAETEEEDQVAAKEADADEEEDDDTESTPEIDVGVDDAPPLSTDDDDDDTTGPAGKPDDGMSEFSADDETSDEDEDDADVPFLEDEDEEDSFEEEIDGLPGEGDEEDR
jgi:uncharacterized protein (TIGR02300 family)